jgi:hypothetical protein
MEKSQQIFQVAMQLPLCSCEVGEGIYITSFPSVLIMNPPVTILWLSNAAIGQRVPCMVRICSKIFSEKLSLN